MKIKTIPVKTDVDRPINLTTKKGGCFIFFRNIFSNKLTVNIQVYVLTYENPFKTQEIVKF